MNTAPEQQQMLAYRPLFLWLATLAYCVSQGNLIRLIGPLDPSIFSLQLAFSVERFAAVLQAWGAEGLARYHEHFNYDFLHPLIYGAFGYIWARYSPLFVSASRGVFCFWVICLPIAGWCDLIENTLHVFLLRQEISALSEWMVLGASGAAAIKWTLALLFTLRLLFGAVRQWKRA